LKSQYFTAAAVKLFIAHGLSLHIIENKPKKYYCVHDLYKNYNTLLIPELHKFQLLCLVHKYVHYNNHLPVVFATYFSLNNEFHLYHTRSSNHLHLYCV